MLEFMVTVPLLLVKVPVLLKPPLIVRVPAGAVTVPLLIKRSPPISALFEKLQPPVPLKLRSKNLLLPVMIPESVLPGVAEFIITSPLLCENVPELL